MPIHIIDDETKTIINEMEVIIHMHHDPLALKMAICYVMGNMIAAFAIGTNRDEALSIFHDFGSIVADIALRAFNDAKENPPIVSMEGMNSKWKM